MSFVELFMISLAVSMAAFASSICRGLSLRRFELKAAIIVALYFAGFQAFMPFIGYQLGAQFHGYVDKFDHWLVFFILTVIGIGIIREAKNEGVNNERAASESSGQSPLHHKIMLLLAFSTSVDALAVGVSFAFLEVMIIPAVLSFPARRLHLNVCYG